MRVLLATAVAAVLLFAGAAEAKDRICSGKAQDGDKEPSVTVDFRIGDDGAVVSRRAKWSLPSNTVEVTGVIIGLPQLDVEYDAPTEAALGPPARLAGAFLLFTDNDRLVKDAAFTFQLPDGRQWDNTNLGSGKGNMAGMGIVMTAGQFEATAYAELFTDFDGFGRARLMLRRGNVMIIAGLFDFAGRAERDRFFPQAWARAVEAAKDPKKCPKAD